jgi:hypothetical protein
VDIFLGNNESRERSKEQKGERGQNTLLILVHNAGLSECGQNLNECQYLSSISLVLMIEGIHEPTQHPKVTSISSGALNSKN